MHPYLLASSPEVVRIDDTDNTWVWRNNDSTAVFAGQLAEILENIASVLNGLPTITSVLCVASALRHWESDAVWDDRLRGMMLHNAGTTGLLDTGRPKLVRWFSKIAAQKEQFRTGTIATVSIFGCGLAGRPDLLEITDRQTIAEVLQSLRIPNEDREPFNPVYALSDQELVSHCLLTWDTLLQLSESVSDTAVLETWQKTGLRELPQASEAADNLPTQTLHETLKTLEDDETYGSLARYSRELSGLISLPRRVADPDDMPQGGVSDVTNRGNPEQLLMTELAAEPLVLLARIANGQALYMRKETPPGMQASTRPVLVESGIQCWGMTRVRMAAFALAVASSERRRASMDTEFYLLESSRYLAVDSSSRDGIFGLIECLDTGEHPGHALVKFFNDQSDRLRIHSELAEPLLITSAATWRNSDFRHSISPLQQPFLAAVVERDGTVRIVRKTTMGEETIQSLKLDLTEEQLRHQVRTKSTKPMFTLQPFPPMAFSPAGHEIDWLADEHANGDACTWLLTHDRRLLRFTSALHGGEEVCDAIPPGRVLLSYVSNSRLELVLASSHDRQEWVRVEAGSRAAQIKTIGTGITMPAYAFSGRYILRFRQGTCDVFLRSDGIQVATYQTNRRHVGSCYQADEDNAIWIHGGAAPDDWHCLGRVEADRIKTGNPKIGGVICNQAGTWALSCDLNWAIELCKPDQSRAPQVIEIESKSNAPAPHNARPIMGNSWRNRWVFESSSPSASISTTNRYEKKLFLLDLNNHLASPLLVNQPSEVLKVIFPTAYQLVRSKPIRRRVNAATLSAEGIVFEKESGVYFLLCFATNHPQRLMVIPSKRPKLSRFATFGDPYKIDDNSNRIWTLRQANIQGGVCWVDSRGLFHFKRDDQPDELTLALADSHVSGWFSGCGFFGPKYFCPKTLDKHEDVPLPNAVEKWLKQWFQQASR